MIYLFLLTYYANNSIYFSLSNFKFTMNYEFILLIIKQYINHYKLC